MPTRAPSRAKRTARAWPMPVPDPVTSATLSLSRPEPMCANERSRPSVAAQPQSDDCQQREQPDDRQRAAEQQRRRLIAELNLVRSSLEPNRAEQRVGDEYLAGLPVHTRGPATLVEVVENEIARLIDRRADAHHVRLRILDAVRRSRAAITARF